MLQAGITFPSEFILTSPARRTVSSPKIHNSIRMRFPKQGGEIRFQPFFISGAKVSNDEMRGRGLFHRGLHFSGNITPGNVILSCECDCCKRSFQIHSFHSGFSNAGYFYSGSGNYTLTLSDRIPGCPAALSKPDPAGLAALEAKLPLAPDSTSYTYTNPFRCPHCFAPYIDFESHPGDRVSEYYGNYFVGSEPLRLEPS